MPSSSLPLCNEGIRAVPAVAVEINIVRDMKDLCHSELPPTLIAPSALVMQNGSPFEVDIMSLHCENVESALEITQIQMTAEEVNGNFESNPVKSLALCSGDNSEAQTMTLNCEMISSLLELVQF